MGGIHWIIIIGWKGLVWIEVGVIVRPIESSPFRLGFAVHTPTWYDLRESYNATLSSDILAYEKPISRH